MTLHMRQAVITDLPAIFRGEEAYIRQWEPQHEAAWRSQTERHLTQWVDNFERMTVAVLNNQLRAIRYGPTRATVRSSTPFT
jgi:ribosomal-protein-alanine N-acetyltransferase